MVDLPQPLTPADCDLRGLPYMPLDVIRLLDSNMFAITNGEEFKAAVALWCKSWTQVPAASLPNDDRVLAHLSGAAARWKKIKASAMHGWILCSDDRWYHPTVAEKALAALPGREEFKGKKTADAERKARERDDRKALFEFLKSHNIVPDWNVSTKQLRGMASQYQSQEITDLSRDMSQQVTVSKGEGEGEGRLTSTTPKPPGGGFPEPDPKPPKTGAIALQTFLADCEAKSERPLRGYAPLWTYAKEAGLESDFVALAWAEFRRRFTPGGPQPEKRQKDWRATFRKYVENNYFKLWAIDKDGVYFLTSQGKQAQKVHETREAS